MNLLFAADLKRQDYNNTIDIYLSDDAEEVIGDNVWQKYFACLLYTSCLSAKAADISLGDISVIVIL